MTYQTFGDYLIIRSDGAVIPKDPGNTDYQAYLIWVAEGNIATPSPTQPI